MTPPCLALRAAALSLVLSAVAVAQPKDDGRPRLLVLDFAAAGGADPSLSKSLAEATTIELSRRGLFHVVSAQDVQTLLGLERQKQLVGCSEAEAQSCLTELAGALGAQFILSGSLSRFGETYQLNLQTLDSARAQPVGRSTRLASSTAALRAELPVAVAEATGTPLPPPPSRVLPYSLIGAGAASVLGGAALGIYALNNDAALARELQTGETARAVLQPRADYDRQVSEISTQRTLSLALLAGGVALIAAGVVTMPSAQYGGGQVMLVPAGRGVALVGVLR